MNQSLRKKIIFSVIFVVLGLVALQVSLTHLAGSKATFTLFDAFAPIAGGFLGGILGAISVLIMELIQFFIHGSVGIDLGNIIRFLPPMFAAFYFARPNRFNWLIPVLAILAFNLNPIGRQVWYFSLYWLIPIVCYFYQERSLFIRSLGATFAAHALGGAIWIWTFHLPKAVWLGLIPIVAIERLTFTFGIVFLYLAVNNLVNVLVKKNIISDFGLVDQKYVWSRVKA